VLDPPVAFESKERLGKVCVRRHKSTLYETLLFIGVDAIFLAWCSGFRHCQRN